MAFAVQQAILADDLCARIAYNGRVMMRNLVPHFARMLLVIDADRNQLRIEFVEIGLSLRELAQLLDAERSPVSAIKEQHDFVTALGRKSKRLALGIL